MNINIYGFFVFHYSFVGDERRTAEEEEAVTLNERKAEDPLQQWRIGLTDRIK